VLFVGRITRQKGIVHLLDAAVDFVAGRLLTHARVFVCPSVYEPFGIVNLEAMACAVPVVASAVGGIPEIVVPEVTGKLVPLKNDGSSFGTPIDRKQFAQNMARDVNELLEDPQLAKRMGEAGRRRVIDVFSWQSIAQQTAALYRTLCG
jgi:starch synthase